MEAKITRSWLSRSWKTGIRLTTGSSLPRPAYSAAVHVAFYPTNSRATFSDIKRPQGETNHSLSPCTKDKNAFSFISASLQKQEELLRYKANRIFVFIYQTLSRHV
jgi:hypothetical protein